MVLLTAYEMRIGKSKPLDRKAAFKVNKNAKEKQESEKEESLDELEANFVRKLKKGKGKYKGKLPLKCFNCDGVRHFVVKYPIKGKNENNDESYKEKGDKKKSHFRKGNSSRRSFL